MAEKILMKLEREAEEKVLKSSITEGGKEGKSDAITFLQVFGGEVSRMQQKELYWRRVLKRWDRT